jgi:uncharacterized protein YqfB (UPF0267 family)
MDMYNSSQLDQLNYSRDIEVAQIWTQTLDKLTHNWSNVIRSTYPTIDTFFVLVHSNYQKITKMEKERR